MFQIVPNGKLASIQPTLPPLRHSLADLVLTLYAQVLFDLHDQCTCCPGARRRRPRAHAVPAGLAEVPAEVEADVAVPDALVARMRLARPVDGDDTEDHEGPMGTWKIVPEFGQGECY